MRKIDCYEHAITRERKVGHPGADLVLPTVRGLQQRSKRTGKPSSLSSWAQFVDFEGSIYFYDFSTRTRHASFPQLDKRTVPSLYYPARQLEPSAASLAQAGEALVQVPEPRGSAATLSHEDYEDAIEQCKQAVWEPQLQARALTLAHNPCPLDEVVMNAQYIGLHPVNERELMWLVDAMLTPQLPVGWLRRSTAEGTEYYWNAIVGCAQWEHPYVSYLSGVASGLVKLKAAVAAAEEASQAAAELAQQQLNSEAPTAVRRGSTKSAAPS